MKTISYQEDLTNEGAERIMCDNDLENSNLIVYGLWKRFVGSGHYKLSVELLKATDINDSVTLSKTITNMQIIDDWNEDEPTYYESKEQVMELAFNEILTAANIETIEDFITYPS